MLGTFKQHTVVLNYRDQRNTTTQGVTSTVARKGVKKHFNLLSYSLVNGSEILSKTRNDEDIS